MTSFYVYKFIICKIIRGKLFTFDENILKIAPNLLTAIVFIS